MTAAGKQLSFSDVPQKAGGTVSLTIRRYVHPVLLAQTPGCASAVKVGHQYRASLHYRSSTSAVTLVLLVHRAGAWRQWYASSARLHRTNRFAALSALLRPVQGGVDRVALGLLVRAPGSVQAKGLSLVDAGEHTRAHHATAGGAVAPVPPLTPSTPALPPPADPASVGSWHILEDVEHARTVHAVQLQNGKLLLMAGSGNSRMEFEAGKFRSFLFDPIADSWKELVTPKDVFCSGHVQLADGNVLILGGTSEYPPAPKAGELPSTKYKGENKSWIFNIATEEYEEVPWDKLHPNQPSEPGPLLNGTWYPSATELGNGDVISFGGLNEKHR